MNKRQKKKLHKKYLEDVTFEISMSNIWRKKLFQSKYEECFIIDFENQKDIPKYLKSIFNKYKLRYYISKVKSCPEYFDDDLVIFKVNPKEFPSLIRYSGNHEHS